MIEKINITISSISSNQISHSSRHFLGALRALYLVLHHREEECVHRPGRLGVGEVGSGEGDLPIFSNFDGVLIADFWLWL